MLYFTCAGKLRKATSVHFTCLEGSGNFNVCRILRVWKLNTSINTSHLLAFEVRNPAKTIVVRLSALFFVKSRLLVRVLAFVILMFF